MERDRMGKREKLLRVNVITTPLALVHWSHHLGICFLFIPYAFCSSSPTFLFFLDKLDVF